MSSSNTPNRQPVLQNQAKAQDPKHLTTIYKKNGNFDKQRKELLENFKESETCKNLLLKLQIMIESKVKHDPLILMKNKGKMAALIQGEIVNQRSGSHNLSNNNTTDKGTGVSLSEKESYTQDSNGPSNTILGIVDRDIQEKIIESEEFQFAIKEELRDIKRRLLGISDEEYAQIKEDERLKLEKRQKEELARKLRLEQEMKNREARSFYQKKKSPGPFGGSSSVSGPANASVGDSSGAGAGAGGISVLSGNYRVGKSAANYRNAGYSASQEKSEQLQKKKDKPPVMMY